LQAERGADAEELDYARRRFLLECRAAKIEPVDAPYTFSDTEGCVRETLFAKRLGYQCKSLVNSAMVASVIEVLRPNDSDISLAKSIVTEFEAARKKGLDRVLVAGQWVEVPTYLNAQRLLKKLANF
jgi:citrate lyase subunit beta/citryl-CoA lyase